jgi:thioredoxin-related protein
MKTNPLLRLLFLCFMLVAFSSNAAQAQAKKKSMVATTDKIEWLTIEEVAEKMKTAPRKVVIDVYTDWCGWCKKMDQSTFNNPEVIAYVNKNYYAVKLNAEGKEPISVMNKTYNYNPEYKVHELAAAFLQGQMSYPSTVYLDEQLRMLTPVPGYLDAPTFSKILKYFGEDNHKTMSYQEFEKQ